MELLYCLFLSLFFSFCIQVLMLFWERFYVSMYTGLKGRCVWMVYGWKWENNILIDLLYCLFSPVFLLFCIQLLMRSYERGSCVEGRRSYLLSKYGGIRRRFEFHLIFLFPSRCPILAWLEWREGSDILRAGVQRLLDEGGCEFCAFD